MLYRPSRLGTNGLSNYPFNIKTDDATSHIFSQGIHPKERMAIINVGGYEWDDREQLHISRIPLKS